MLQALPDHVVIGEDPVPLRLLGAEERPVLALKFVEPVEVAACGSGPRLNSYAAIGQFVEGVIGGLLPSEPNADRQPG